MAVYTQVSNEQLDQFLENYQLGRVLALKGIAEGVENSNYFLQTEQGSFILTLYEKRVQEHDLSFFLGLMNHLAHKGLRVATALQRNDRTYYGHIGNRAAAIISFLSGRWQNEPSLSHCARLGEALAQLHIAAKDFKHHRNNQIGIAQFQTLLKSCRGLEPALSDELENAIQQIEKNWPDDLPDGIIHGDLFPDNVLFDGQQAGMIDFYFACQDMLTYDIAICLNAWCWNKKWNHEKATHLLAGYQQYRPLSQRELEALPILCKGAAIRFLLTRLADQIEFEQGRSLVQPKNPNEYLNLLRFHQKGEKIYDHPDLD